MRAAVRRIAIALAALAWTVAAFGSAQDGGSDDASAPEGLRRVVIGASGDILFHTRVLDVAEARGMEHVFSGLRAIVRPEEIAFANLETPLSMDREPMRGNPPRLGAPPEAAGVLAEVGLDVLSVANNHVWDQGHLGLADTLHAVHDAGILAVGSAATDELAPGPVIIEREGVRVAFVAWTNHIQGYAGTRRPVARVAMYEPSRAVRRALEEARARADVVVASMHWGLAYRNEHRSEQRSAAAYLIRHGADVVLGHGPHVLQPVERASSPRGEAVIAYSLGNLVSNQGYLYRGRRERGVERPLWEPATRDGVWLRIAVDVVGGEVRIGDIDGVPLWTHNNHWDVERRRAAAPDIHVMPLGALGNPDLRAERRRAIARVLGEHVRLD